jgi:GMP synthase-like glutamine amidotransferase
MKPFLVVDCYIDDPGGAPAFLDALSGHAAEVFRMRSELPADPSVYSGILVTGSAASVNGDWPWIAPLCRFIRLSVSQGVPFLGVCFGHQVLAHALGGAVSRAAEPEVGWVQISRKGESALFAGLPTEFDCFVSHEDEVSRLPPGGRLLARSAACGVQAFQVGSAPVWGIQFHPEMSVEESCRLVRWRAERHPGLGLDVEAMIGSPEASRTLPGLRERIFGAFVGQAAL